MLPMEATPSTPASSSTSPFVERLISDGLVSLVIFINSIVLVILGFYPADFAAHASTPVAMAAFWIDYACTWFFIVEATLKIRKFSWEGYWSNGWNRFDFLVVLISLPALVAPLVPSLGGWSTLLILRTGRLLRLIKLMRFIPDADGIFNGVKRALRASIGVFATLLVLVIIFGLIASSLFGGLDSEAARHAFGDPLSSFYTIFKTFTIEGWYSVPEQIAVETSQPVWATVVRLYFMLTVVVGGIFGLSIANAIFIDEMVADNNDALEAEVQALRVQLEAAEERHAEERAEAARERKELLEVLAEVKRRLGAPGDDR